MRIQLVDWSDKLSALKVEADQLRAELKSLYETPRKERDPYLMNYIKMELSRINNEIYHLVVFKPIFIEENIE